MVSFITAAPWSSGLPMEVPATTGMVAISVVGMLVVWWLLRGVDGVQVREDREVLMVEESSSEHQRLDCFRR